MKKFISLIIQGNPNFDIIGIKSLQKELIRKVIHSLIIFIPFLAEIHMGITLIALIAGMSFYLLVESIRDNGVNIPIISNITLFVMREREKGKFIFAPITLGIGTLLSLLLFPLPIAKVAIFSLAFGDSIACLVGMNIKSPKIPFTNGKSFAGSVACFVVVLLCSYKITGEPLFSFLLATGAAFLEALPTGSLDNIVLPLGVGLIGSFLFPF